MGRTRVDLYQLDPEGQADGSVIKLVGGVATWSSDLDTGLVNANFVDGEVPSGSINDANTVFGLASASLADPHVYLDGIRLKEGSGNDYVFEADNQTITMEYAPQTGQNLIVDYRKA